MICGADDLKGFGIRATDGAVGVVRDVYFDDERWVIRYLAVDAGKRLPGREVLISPLMVHTTDWWNRHLKVTLTRQQVKDSPNIDTDKSISRQHEASYSSYYGYLTCWDAANLWAGMIQPAASAPSLPEVKGVQAVGHMCSEQATAYAGSLLHSARELFGYQIHALNGTVGHIEDILFDEDTWEVCYIVVDTRSWWPGKQVLIAPQWIEAMDWANHTARVHVTCAMIKHSPPYHPHVPLPGSYEKDLPRCDGRPFGS